jgi:hypothetical protein
MVNYYGNERPEGGKIVDGVIFSKYAPFAILYTLAEGAKFEVLGCANEEVADAIVKTFEETGEMDNPSCYFSEIHPTTIRPYTVMKLEVKASKVWVPTN